MVLCGAEAILSMLSRRVRHGHDFYHTNEKIRHNHHNKHLALAVINMRRP